MEKGAKKDARGQSRDNDDLINEKIQQGMKNVMPMIIQKLITLVDEKVENRVKRD